MPATSMIFLWIELPEALLLIYFTSFFKKQPQAFNEGWFPGTGFPIKGDGKIFLLFIIF